MTDSAPAMPMVPRLRDERKGLDDRAYSRYRRDYWRVKQEQAEAVLDAVPMRRQIEERLALCDVTPGRNGGVWL